jgi:hypothetical protein
MTGHQPRKKRVAGDPKPPPSGTGVSAPRTDVEPGRVWLTLARKYRVAEYESLTVDLGASSPLEPGETQSQALKRVFAELREDFGDVVEVMKAQEGM